jgi:SAM-dependent methyltransferase
MNKFEITANNIAPRLLEVAKAFGPPAKYKILFENYGKYLFEIQLILKNLGDGTRILDVGGGMGVNLLCIQRLVNQDLKLHLVDRFEEYTEENRMGPSDRGLKLMGEAKISVITQDFWLNAKLPFKSDFFDVATIFAVVEHLPGHPLRLLREIRRVLKHNGKIILGGPNSVSLVKKVKLLFGKHPYIPFDLWIADKYYSHYREYNRKEYRRLIELSGFKHIQTIMSLEHSKTRAHNRYRNCKHGLFTPITMGLYGIYISHVLLPILRPSVYCVGEKI